MNSIFGIVCEVQFLRDIFHVVVIIELKLYIPKVKLIQKL